MMYIILAMGLNIVVGYARLLDLGYVAFYVIGAYAQAFLTSPNSIFVQKGYVPGFMQNFWVAMLFSGSSRPSSCHHRLAHIAAPR